MIECYITDEEAMLAFGQKLAEALMPGTVIYMHGQLGAGKTTLVRGILQAMGYQGRVKSPTYTLVEPYEVGGQWIYHFDLYRLAEPEELEYIGIRDYDNERAICLIEWPEKGHGLLPAVDINCYIGVQLPGRQVKLLSESKQGGAILSNISLPK